MADLVVAGNQVQSRGVIHGFAPLKLEECKVALRGQKTTTFQKKKVISQNTMTFPKTLFFCEMCFDHVNVQANRGLELGRGYRLHRMPLKPIQCVKDFKMFSQLS